MGTFIVLMIGLAIMVWIDKKRPSIEMTLERLKNNTNIVYHRWER